ncbi:MAG: hypothetical protein ACFFAS_06635 [Promethearchaeota archaeon]
MSQKTSIQTDSIIYNSEPLDYPNSTPQFCSECGSKTQVNDEFCRN